jgi:ferredoxin-thioredoxin reductase catalytic subunit
MSVEIKVVRKSGYELNPNDTVVNDIFRQLERNHGHCPTVVQDRDGHDYCPCHDWLANNKCYCGLYVKKDNGK